MEVEKKMKIHFASSLRRVVPQNLDEKEKKTPLDYRFGVINQNTRIRASPNRWTLNKPMSRKENYKNQ